MIKFSKDKVLLLHKLISKETGGTPVLWLQRSHFCAIVRKAAQGAAGDVPLPGLAQLLLFTLSIHGNTRPAQYGIAYKKSQCFLAFILITEVFTNLSECGMVKASTYAR